MHRHSDAGGILSQRRFLNIKSGRHIRSGHGDLGTRMDEETTLGRHQSFFGDAEALLQCFGQFQFDFRACDPHGDRMSA